MRRIRSSLLASLAVMLSGCGAPFMPSASPTEPAVMCTLIGCDSQIAFELAVNLEAGETHQVEVCLDQRCQAAAVEVPPQGIGLSDNLLIDAATDTVTLVLPEGDYSGTHTVSLELFVTERETIGVEAEIEFERLQPNGSNCEPVCWQATIRM